MKWDGGVGEPGGSVVELYLSRLLAAYRPIEVDVQALVRHGPQADGSPAPDDAPDLDAEHEPATADAASEADAGPSASAATSAPDADRAATGRDTPAAEPEPASEADAGPDTPAADAEPDAEVPAVVLDADLSDVGLIDRLREQAASVAAVQAAQFVTAAEFARRRSDTSGEVFGAGALSEFAADEVASALTLTRWSADRLLEDATRLTSTLTGTWDALAGGRTDLVRARMVCRATAALPDDAASAVDEAITDRLPTSTTTQLKDVLAAEVIAVDPARAEKATAQAAAERAVTCWPVDDGPAGPVGMAELRAVGPAPQVLDLMDALTAVATRPSPSCPTGRGIDVGPDGQPRGVDARRFDALVDLASGAADAVPGAAARRPAVNVTVALSTLLGADEHPAHLDGYGPVTAGLARRIARTGTLRRLLTDPVTGVVVGADSHTHPWDSTLAPPDDDDDPPDAEPHGDDPPDAGPAGDGGPSGGGPPGHGGPPDHSNPGVDGGPRGAVDGPAGSEGGGPPGTGAVTLRRAQDGCPVRAAGGGLYRPGRVLDRLVRARDARCAAPGCRRRAHTCDVDHVIRHPDGPTCACNLQPLCRRHHRMKHQTAWTVVRWHDGPRTWTTPTGHAYLLDPPTALPVPQTRHAPDQTSDGLDESVHVSRFDNAVPGITALRHRVHAAAEDAPPPPSADSTVDAHDDEPPPF